MIGFGQDQEINWGENLDLAFDSASISNKIIMIEFMAQWCPPCKKMEKETFSNERVIKKLNEFVDLILNNQFKNLIDPMSSCD